MATGTTASNDKSVMNPLLAPSDAQDQLPGFPQILRYVKFISHILL